MRKGYPRPNKSAFEKSIDFLAKRDHSEKELTEKLELRQYTNAEIKEALDELWEQNYLLPPEELAEKLTNQLNLRGKGKSYIQQYLQKKGLPNTEISSDTEFQKGLDLIERKLRCKPPFTWELKAKITRYLGNRGFDYDSIRRIINYEES